MSRKKKRPNPGWFRAGDDPRRHELTTEERQLGYARAMESTAAKGAGVHAWLFRRVRSWGRARRREAAALAG